MAAGDVDRCRTPMGRCVNVRPEVPVFPVGAPDRIRTCDLPLRRRTLYPAELPGLVRDAARAALVVAPMQPYRLRRGLVSRRNSGVPSRIAAFLSHENTHSIAGRHRSFQPKPRGAGFNSNISGSLSQVSCEVLPVSLVLCRLCRRPPVALGFNDGILRHEHIPQLEDTNDVSGDASSPAPSLASIRL